jgi:hypothetical protein
MLIVDTPKRFDEVIGRPTACAAFLRQGSFNGFPFLQRQLSHHNAF